ncbi:ATP-binding protein [Sporolactobacillus sp. STCC-11]|uniref:AAA family ATPase n=1 Tax=Sporolactobacillus caesalpiniae TaxID=3230362 RepID=UPI00339B2235
MILQFSVGNFLSFRDEVTLSMVASRITEHKDTHLIKLPHINLLKTAVVYGANSSGKSNLIKAINFMKNFVRLSSKEGQIGEEIGGIDSFKLNTVNADKPSLFEIVFVHQEKQYRYGFQADRKEVKNEWLYVAHLGGKEKELFYRENGEISVTKDFPEGEGLEKRTRINALFLSVVANLNGEIATSILYWFKSLRVLDGLTDFTVGYTMKKIQDASSKKELMILINKLDLGIEDLIVEDETLPKGMYEFIKKFSAPVNTDQLPAQHHSISTLHKKYDGNNQFVGLEKFRMAANESEGTKKIISLLGPIIDTLNNGRILVVDELDAKLHPLLTRFIIRLFHSNEFNKKSAQLIFNSHDTNLLSKEFFRRDQLWFTEKDEYGATDLYALSDYKVRKDASYEKDYLHGKYGSIPYIGSFDFSDKEGRTKILSQFKNK